MSRDPTPARAVLVSGVPVVSAFGAFDRDATLSPDGVHELVRRFRAGDVAAASAVRAAVRELLETELQAWPAPVTAIVVPAHDGGPQRALGELVEALTTEIGLARSTPDALQRVVPIQEAKRRGPSDPHRQMASLRVHPAAIAATARTLVLVDDVLATGGTLAACVAALRRGGWRGEIRGVVLAFANGPNGPPAVHHQPPGSEGHG